MFLPECQAQDALMFSSDFDENGTLDGPTLWGPEGTGIKIGGGTRTGLDSGGYVQIKPVPTETGGVNTTALFARDLWDYDYELPGAYLGTPTDPWNVGFFNFLELDSDGSSEIKIGASSRS